MPLCIMRLYYIVLMRRNESMSGRYWIRLYNLQRALELVLFWGLSRITCIMIYLLHLRIPVLFRSSMVLLVWIVISVCFETSFFSSRVLGMSLSPEFMFEQPKEGADNLIESLLTMSRNVSCFVLESLISCATTFLY